MYLVLAKYTDESGGTFAGEHQCHEQGHRGQQGEGRAGGLRHRAAEADPGEDREQVSNGRAGKARQWIEQATDLGPILFERTAWQAQRVSLPDGPTERGLVRYVLPDFGEEKVEPGLVRQQPGGRDRRGGSLNR